LQISVLDSSFNPPTLAHLALADAPRPSIGGEVGGEYDAKIYLLSVRNADKTLKPTDASYIQRLEMMLLLAQDSKSSAEVAIGIVDEPTFVGKASKLLAFLQQRLSGLALAPPRPELTFLLGLDTLERLLAPRYYGASPSDPDAVTKMFASLHQFFSPEHHNARVVCARRASSSSTEAATLKLGEHFLSDERIVLIDIGEAEQSYSSTAVRDALRRRDDSWKALVSPGVREYISKAMLYTESATMVE
jgi:nicotinamide-nucleotide adenylyltransferase